MPLRLSLCVVALWDVAGLRDAWTTPCRAAPDVVLEAAWQPGACEADVRGVCVEDHQTAVKNKKECT